MDKVYIVFVATENTYYGIIPEQTHVFKNKEDANKYKQEVISKYKEEHPDLEKVSENKKEDYYSLNSNNWEFFIEVIVFEKEIR